MTTLEQLKAWETAVRPADEAMQKFTKDAGLMIEHPLRDAVYKALDAHTELVNKSVGGSLRLSKEEKYLDSWLDYYQQDCNWGNSPKQVWLKSLNAFEVVMLDSLEELAKVIEHGKAKK